MLSGIYMVYIQVCLNHDPRGSGTGLKGGCKIIKLKNTNSNSIFNSILLLL